MRLGGKARHAAPRRGAGLCGRTSVCRLDTLCRLPRPQPAVQRLAEALHLSAQEDAGRAHLRHPPRGGICPGAGFGSQRVPGGLEQRHEGFAGVCLPTHGRPVRHAHPPLHAARHAGHTQSPASHRVHAQDAEAVPRQALRLPRAQRLRPGRLQRPGRRAERMPGLAHHHQRPRGAGRSGSGPGTHRSPLCRPS